MCTLIRADVAAYLTSTPEDKLSTALQPPPPFRLHGVSGATADILGTLVINIQVNNNDTETTAIVVPKLHCQCILAYKELKTLNVLPLILPKQIDKTSLVTKEELKTLFPTVISDELNKKPMKGGPMRIVLKDNAIPHHVYTARSIPKHLQSDANKLIKDLTSKQVIEKVNKPTEWCSPGFFVAKPGGGVRLVTDFTKLNKFVKRPVHPFPCVNDILKQIPYEAKYFAKLDCKHGYFQMALDEQSQDLTTFLLPSGRYKYKRAGMGLSASSDEWCRRSDVIIQGLPFAMKIVDDTLVWGSSPEEIKKNVVTVLKRCKEENITISFAKLEINTTISFAGYVISHNGIKPSPDLTASISNFPAPKNIHEIRQFLGLVNQVGTFMPDLSQIAAPIRQLLRKNTAWTWETPQEAAFNKLKAAITARMELTPFNPELPTHLVTDASRLHGLGYALMQPIKDGPPNLICCGSKSLNPAEARYSTVELECLAIQYGMRKCDFYLRGHPHFTVITDHRPLVGVFKKSLDDICNPRLLRIREKTIPYNFTVEWMAGKENVVADALSRAPYFPADPEDGDLQLTINPQVQSVTIEGIAEGGDPAYHNLLRHIAYGTPLSQQASQYAGHTDLMSTNRNKTIVLYDGDRVVVPKNLTSDVLQSLHAGHTGENKTVTLAKQLYFWPTMLHDIKNLVKSCEHCIAQMPAKRHPIYHETLPSDHTVPMEMCGADIMTFDKNNYLVLVDKASGFLWCKKLSSMNTKTVTKTLENIFHDFGYPAAIRTDNGPQFRTEFYEYCLDNGISHQTSSPYNPESNGLAEAAVKNAKSLMAKCKAEGSNFEKALLHWRNTPRVDGHSPAQLLLGRRQQTTLPTLPEHHEQINIQEALKQKDRSHMLSRQNANKSGSQADTFDIGERVIMRDEKTQKWTIPATILNKLTDRNSYTVETDDGSVYTRSHRLIRKSHMQTSVSNVGSNVSRTKLDGTASVCIRDSRQQEVSQHHNTLRSSLHNNTTTTTSNANSSSTTSSNAIANNHSNHTTSDNNDERNNPIHHQQVGIRPGHLRSKSRSVSPERPSRLLPKQIPDHGRRPRDHEVFRGLQCMAGTAYNMQRGQLPADLHMRQQTADRHSGMLDLQVRGNVRKGDLRTLCHGVEKQPRKGAEVLIQRPNNNNAAPRGPALLSNRIPGNPGPDEAAGSTRPRVHGRTPEVPPHMDDRHHSAAVDDPDFPPLRPSHQMVAAMSLLSRKIRHQQRSRPAAPEHFSSHKPTIEHELAKVSHHNANPCRSGERVQRGDQQHRHRQGRFPTAEKAPAKIRPATTSPTYTTTTPCPISATSPITTSGRVELRQPNHWRRERLPIAPTVTVLGKQQTASPPVHSGRPHTSRGLPDASKAATDVKSRPTSATSPGPSTAPIRRRL